MTYDHELTLIKTASGDNEMSDPITKETRTEVLCKLKSVGRNEFYQGAATGLKPENVFVIHAYEYSGEKVVEFEGVRYNVIRTYQEGFEEMELVCGGLVNHAAT